MSSSPAAEYALPAFLSLTTAWTERISIPSPKKIADGIVLGGLSAVEEEYAVGQPQTGQAAVQADEILQQVVARKSAY